MSSDPLEHLERMSRMAHRLVLVSGQDATLLKQVEAQEVHPAVAAYGLWRDEPEWAALTDEIRANRQEQSSRPEMTL